MKICFIRIMPYPYTLGGGTTCLRETSKALSELGHEVHIISSKPEKYSKIEEKEYAIVHNVGMGHKKVSNNPLKMPYDLVRRVMYELSFMISSYFLVKKLKPDIIHTRTILTESLPFALLNKPFIASESGQHTQLMGEFYQKKKNHLANIGLWIYRKIEKFNAKRAYTIICVNGETKKYYEKLSGRSGFTTGVDGIDLENYKDIKVKKVRSQYMALSRLTEQKGLTYLLEALKILDKEKPNLKMLIIGDGDEYYTNKLKEMAKEVKNIKIEFLGSKVGKDKLNLYASSAVFIVPSIYETFGITILEAMASKCAVISSDTDGPRITVKKSFGTLVPYKDEGKRAINLAKAIKSSLNWDIRKMGNAAGEEVKKYAMRDLVKKHEIIYKKLIDSNKNE